MQLQPTRPMGKGGPTQRTLIRVLPQPPPNDCRNMGDNTLTRRRGEPLHGSPNSLRDGIVTHSNAPGR
eukprot:8946969-Alexandrium_andersonii.AAC.1